MKSLTIIYCTARQRPEFEWFLDSLTPQIKPGEVIDIIMVDYHAAFDSCKRLQSTCEPEFATVRFFGPIKCKPNVWQGQHRLTKKEWWAKSAYLNTGLCLAKTEWVAFLDDRCILTPTWLQSIREAMAGNYAVAGSYQKRTGMTVEDAFIKHGGIINGEDPRRRGNNVPVPAPGQWWFGCTGALPLEWALAVNGFDESCDSLGMEDVIFGRMLENGGFPIKYDERMMIIEDRTPEFYEAAVGRTDKGVSPNDKSHALLDRTNGKKQSTHHWNLREVRADILAGRSFVVPTEPATDWYDGKPLSEFP